MPTGSPPSDGPVAAAPLGAPSAPHGPQAEVELDPGELIGHGAAFCPNPRMTLWNAHPRVFLELGESGQARCPYCGTRYRLKGGPLVGGH